MCDSLVYFIRPRNGGAVWFDEIGWPWPKHLCMDNDDHRQRYPEPLVASIERVPGMLSAEWPERYGIVLVVPHPTGKYWSLMIGGATFVTPVRPPPFLTSVFLRRQAQGRVELSYLAEVGGEAEQVTLPAYERDLALYGWQFRTRRVDGDDLDWASLQHWVDDATLLTPSQVEDFIESLRSKTDWLLDPGWSRSVSGPSLVRNRVDQVCEKFPGLDPETISAWMRVLLD